MVLSEKRFFFLKLSELRKGKFKANFLGRSVKAKFKVKNVHSSKENHSGFDFPALPSLTRMRTGDGVVGQEGKGGADSERRRKRGARGGGGGGPFNRFFNWYKKSESVSCSVVSDPLQPHRL